MAHENTQAQKDTPSLSYTEEAVVAATVLSQCEVQTILLTDRKMTWSWRDGAQENKEARIQNTHNHTEQ